MHPFMHTQNFLLNVKHTCTISVLAKFVLQVSGIGSIGKNWYRYTSNLYMAWLYHDQDIINSYCNNYSIAILISQLVIPILSYTT